MALEHHECDSLEDEFENHVCHESINHCGHEGKLFVCELHWCVMEHSFENDCKPFCPCENRDSDYCHSL